jgi:hypothetical protein
VAGELVAASGVVDGAIAVLTEKGRLLVQRDGWRELVTMASPSMVTARGLWGASASDVIAFGDGGEIWHNVAGTWRSRRTTTDRTDVSALWGASPDDVFLARMDGAVERRRNGAWSSLPTGLRAAAALWGTSSSDLWVVGSPGAAHFDGRSFQRHDLGGQTLRAIYGSGRADAWAVSDKSAWHYDGATWSPQPAPRGVTLSSVWVGPHGDAWVAGRDDQWGERGMTFRWDAKTHAWQSTPGEVPSVLFGGRGEATNVLVGISGSKLVAWNGSAWSAHPLTSVDGFRSGPQIRMARDMFRARSAAFDAAGLLVLGSGGDHLRLARATGPSVEREELPVGAADAKPMAVLPLPNGEVWMAGAGGAILHRCP